MRALKSGLSLDDYYPTFMFAWPAVKIRRNDLTTEHTGTKCLSLFDHNFKSRSY